jgi:hypothetical protein
MKKGYYKDGYTNKIEAQEIITKDQLALEKMKEIEKSKKLKKVVVNGAIIHTTSSVKDSELANYVSKL